MKHKPPKDLAEELDYFLRDLAVGFGFDGKLSGAELLARHPTLTAEAFARAVIAGEGANPDYEKAWRRELQRAFVDRYGDSVRGSDFLGQNST